MVNSIKEVGKKQFLFCFLSPSIVGYIFFTDLSLTSPFNETYNNLPTIDIHMCNPPKNCRFFL